MSSVELSRVLRVILCTMTPGMYEDSIRGLGHEVLASYRNILELTLAIPGLGIVPDLIITDAAEPEDLVQVYTVCKSRSITVPCIIISDSFANLTVGKETDFIFGVCSAPLNFDSGVLRAVLLIATKRFKSEVDLRFQAVAAKSEAEDVKLIARACAIMQSCGRAKNPITARRMLGKIAASRGRTIVEQARILINLDEESRPKKRVK